MQEQIVPFTSVAFDPENPGLLLVEDSETNLLHIPLHRVRVVYKDGAEIWRRPAHAGSDDAT